MKTLNSTKLNPSSSDLMHEPIVVDATFDTSKNHRCVPKRFHLSSGRVVEITEIGLIHPRFNGLKTFFLFDVTDGISDYRISFDTERLEWFLEWEGDENV